MFKAVAYIFPHDYLNYAALMNQIYALPGLKPASSRINLLGVSYGAHVPLVLKKKINAVSALSFSPTNFLEISRLPPSYFDSDWRKGVKIFYSRKIQWDVEFLRNFRGIHGPQFRSICTDVSNLDNSHSTLQTLYHNGMLDKIINNCTIH